MATCPGQLHAPVIFFKAITKPQAPDLRHISDNYKIGRHPRTYSDLPGNFAYNGGLYVMAVST